MLYHSKVYYPEELKDKVFELVKNLNYRTATISKHFVSKLDKLSPKLSELVVRKIHDWLDAESVIEVEVVDRTIIKLLFRVEFTSVYDLIFAVNGEKTFITCYLNRVADTHHTLDISNYEKEN